MPRYANERLDKTREVVFDDITKTYISRKIEIKPLFFHGKTSKFADLDQFIKLVQFFIIRIY